MVGVIGGGGGCWGVKKSIKEETKSQQRRSEEPYNAKTLSFEVLLNNRTITVNIHF